MIKVSPAVLALTLICSVSSRPQQRVSIVPRVRPAPVVAVKGTVNLRYDVRLVQIPVVVTDAHGTPLLDLDKASFRLFEDEVEQPITAFSMDDAPISATVVFDSSRSMKNRIVEARAGVDQFLRTALPGDEFSLVRFSDRAEILSRFTPDANEISHQLGGVEAHGWTSLFDALCLGVHLVHKGTNQRKVMIAFSDGSDNNSRYSESELISQLREADVEVYAISMFEKPRSLDRIADETGGRAFWVKRMEDLPEAIETLNRQMRNEYLLGYSPSAIENDGKYHRVRVQVRPPAGLQRVQVSWRRGYLAPGE
jgi:Ca-activated chloride channel homolog